MTIPNSTPENYNPIEAILVDHDFRKTAPLFSLARFGVSLDFMNENKRMYAWNPNKFDDLVSSYAGWNAIELVTQGELKAVRSLEIPKGTRPIENLIAGFETRKGEKRGLLKAISEYQSRILSNTQCFDTSVDLESIAVTRDNNVIFMPPHKLTNDLTEIEDWVDNIASEIQTSLDSTTTFESIDQLLDDFKQDVDELSNLLKGQKR